MADTGSDVAEIERLSGAELAILWRRLVRTAPPDLSLDLVRLHLANIVQEREEGGLSNRARRQLRHLRNKIEDIGLTRAQGHEDLEPGTRLIREWRGRIYEAVVTSEGLVFDGRRFSSLTAIAHEITGKKWPGPRFFGLRKRPAANLLPTGSGNV